MVIHLDSEAKVTSIGSIQGRIMESPGNDTFRTWDVGYVKVFLGGKADGSSSSPIFGCTCKAMF